MKKSLIRFSLKSRELLQIAMVDCFSLFFVLVVISRREGFQKCFQVNEDMGKLDKGNTQLGWYPAQQIHTSHPLYIFLWHMAQI